MKLLSLLTVTVALVFTMLTVSAERIDELLSSSLLTSSLSADEPVAGLDAAPAGTFSIVVIPDTHIGLNEDFTRFFDAHTRWIVDNLVSQNIVFVSHVGDIVDKRPGYEGSTNIAPWLTARQFMDRLHGLVPYALAVGNHDMMWTGDSSRFQEFFPAERFAEFDWYGGFYPGDPERPPYESGNNANSYQLFSAGGYDFIFLHLENNAPDNVLEWADNILSNHADRLALVTTHMDLGPVLKDEPPKGRMCWSKNHGSRGNNPQNIWEKLYRRHPHLRIIFSGDQSETQTMRQEDTGDHGNKVNAFKSDYRGILRLYRFIPTEQKLQVFTLNSTSGRLVSTTTKVPDREQHQFTVPFDFSLFALGSAPAASILPKLEIMANGTSCPITLTQNEHLLLEVSVKPNAGLHYPADYWVRADTPMGLFWLNEHFEFVRSDQPIRIHGGPLIPIDRTPILNSLTSNLPLGDYLVTFAIDNNQNEIFEGSFQSTVNITVVP